VEAHTLRYSCQTARHRTRNAAERNAASLDRPIDTVFVITHSRNLLGAVGSQCFQLCHSLSGSLPNGYSHRYLAQSFRAASTDTYAFGLITVVVMFVGLLELVTGSRRHSDLRPASRVAVRSLGRMGSFGLPIVLEALSHRLPVISHVFFQVGSFRPVSHNCKMGAGDLSRHLGKSPHCDMHAFPVEQATGIKGKAKCCGPDCAQSDALLRQVVFAI
jgi:hypothetical protein